MVLPTPVNSSGLRTGNGTSALQIPGSHAGQEVACTMHYKCLGHLHNVLVEP